MNNSANILSYYSSTHAAYLHSKGKFATQILLERLDCKENENILEIGFGTGATLVHLSSVYQKNNFYGLEFSKAMYDKAEARTRFCLCKNVSLKLSTDHVKLPYDDLFFDKIYLESVLAIQEGEDANLLLAEIYRALKPGGKLLINEGIWLDNVPKEKIIEMNAFCKNKFGIIQASEKYPYAADWKFQLEKNGFTIESSENVDNTKVPVEKKRGLSKRFLSALFSAYGKLKSKINPKFRKLDSEYKKQMKVLAGEKQYLQGIIFKSKK